MLPFKIRVTRKIIHQCKYAGTPGDENILGNVCPVAVAVKDMFPYVYVANDFLYPYGKDTNLKIELPSIAKHFITLFDSLSTDIETRLLIPTFEFDIEIPDEVIEMIKIEKDLFELQLA
ncbi:MAG: hypothetical protein JST96_19210 [Bacteroidetes bacterium]|nr:hypothetical protein [Bacteroidota bacterium]